MEIKWIKIATNIFDDEKILLIETMPEADAIIVIWFKLLCMSGKQNNNGVFMLNDKIAYTDEMLSAIFRKPINIVRLALKTFENFGMIEIIDDVITIPNWEKHQNIDGLEKIREQTRLRVAKHRAKQKLLIENNENESVALQETFHNAIEEEKEEEKNKNNKKNKEKDFLETEFSNPEVISTIQEFIKMRKLIKKPLTDFALTKLCNKLKKLSNDDNTQIKILEQSIMNNWQDIYELKNDSQPKTNKGNGSKTNKGNQYANLG